MKSSISSINYSLFDYRFPSFTQLSTKVSNPHPTFWNCLLLQGYSLFFLHKIFYSLYIQCCFVYLFHWHASAHGGVLGTEFLFSVKAFSPVQLGLPSLSSLPTTFAWMFVMSTCTLNIVFLTSHSRC